MGSVEPYETAAGRRYRVRYRTPGHRQTDKRGFKTKKEAELFLATIEIAKSRGEFVNAADAKALVGSLGPRWLERKQNLKPSALRPLEIAWRLQVEPNWGRISVGHVRHSDVQSWVNELAKSKSATTVLRAYGVLAGILDVAVRDRRITSNPARGVELPRKKAKSRAYLSHEQVELLATSSGPHGTLVRFLAYTGLRWGEATALRIRDVDVERRRLSVRENAVMVGGRIEVGTPKSGEERTVGIPAFLAAELAATSAGKKSDCLLFGDGTSFLRPPDSRRGWWTSAVRQAQESDKTFPRLTRHDLRHTAASLSISAGANVKVLQNMLGHASAAMTLDTYADLFEEDVTSVADALDEARLRASVGKMWADRIHAHEEAPKIAGISGASDAVPVGFEPTDGLHHHMFSRHAPSAARTRYRERV